MSDHITPENYRRILGAWLANKPGRAWDYTAYGKGGFCVFIEEDGDRVGVFEAASIEAGQIGALLDALSPEQAAAYDAEHASLRAQLPEARSELAVLRAQNGEKL